MTRESDHIRRMQRHADILCLICVMWGIVMGFVVGACFGIYHTRAERDTPPAVRGKGVPE